MKNDERKGMPSASSFERLWHCPGSYQLSRTARSRPVPQSKYADSGSKVHNSLMSDNTSGLTEEELKTYNEIVGAANPFIQNWCNNHGHLPQQRESRFWLHSSTLKPIFSAKLDIALFDPKEDGNESALMIDYKSGHAKQKTSDTWQIRCQAVALRNAYPHLETIWGVIVRPNFVLIPAVYSTATLDYYENQIQLHLSEVFSGDAPRRPGEWCTYCPCRDDCNESISWAASVAPKKEVAKADIPKYVETLDDDRICEVIKRRPVIKSILDAVSARGLTMPEDTLKRHDLKIQESNKPTIHGETAFNILQPEFGDDIVEAISFKMDSLVNLVAKRKGVAKTKAREYINQRLEGAITTSTSKSTVSK